MICRKIVFLAGLTLCICAQSLSQVVSSAQSGYWHDAATWTDGIVPSHENTDWVIVEHSVIVTGSASVRNVDVRSVFTVSGTGSLDIVPVTGEGSLILSAGGHATINGILIGRDDITYSSSPSNLVFGDNSWFRYVGGSRGFIPIASWSPRSNFLIGGFVGSGYIAIAYSDSWKQEFGNVIYNCPLQTSFVDLNGYLRTVKGDLVIQHTNSQSLRLSTTQRPLIRVQGNLIVEGPSEVWFTTTSDSATIEIGGDFRYLSSSNGPSYLTTRGRCFMTIGGRLSVDAAGPIRISSGSADSTGVRRGTIRVSDGVFIRRGSLIAPSPGKGIIQFNPGSPQSIDVTNNCFVGNFDFHVLENAVVDFGESELRNTTGDLFVKGHIRVASLHPGGAIQNAPFGNIQVAGARRFYDGAVVEYNGTSTQHIADGHPTHSGVDLIIMNDTETRVDCDLVCRNLTVSKGVLYLQDRMLTVTGDIAVAADGTFESARDVQLIGSRDQLLSFNGALVRTLTVEKTAASDVRLLSALRISELLHIRNGPTTFFSDGHLTLLSSNDAAGGTAVLGPLESGSSIAGNVTVERFMSGKGRIYRYISSPVSDATVASLMDDFPVTGTFLDPSRGRGITSANPSLFLYDATDPVEGWKPYPTTGYAHENLLVPGRGYAAFIREGIAPTKWDVTGLINQGIVPLPVSFSVDAHEPHRGWNLLGNPYPAPLQWGSPLGWNMSADIGHCIAVRDNGEGRFRYSDGEIGDLSGGLIGLGQAFWVRASANDPFLVVDENAKAIYDAAFYREGGQSHDYIRVKLFGNSLTDETFLRLRANATPAFDLFDAGKMNNDFINLSTLTTDGVEVAINAVGDFDCEEIIPLRIYSRRTHDGNMVRIPAGSYNLSFEAFGLLRSSQVLIVDHFLKDTLANQSILFEAGLDSASSSAERFSLVLKQKPTPRLPLTSLSLTCNDESLKLDIEDHDGGAVSVVVADSVFRSDKSARIILPASLFVPGKAVMIPLLYADFCGTRLLDSISVKRNDKPVPPLLRADAICGPGPFTIRVIGENANALSLYDEPALQRPLYRSFDSDLIIPMLHASTIFYATATDTNGCESSASVVDAVVLQTPNLEVYRDGTALHSNSHDTWWYLEGIPLFQGQQFAPTRAGQYTALLSENGCTSLLNVPFDLNAPIDIYPVPFDTELHIRAGGGEDLKFLSLIDMKGVEIIRFVPNEKSVTIDVKALASGCYTVIAEVGFRRYYRRVIKKQ